METHPRGCNSLGHDRGTSRRILGRTRHLHSYVVTEFEPYKVFGMTDKFPGMRRMHQRFTFEPTADGTRVTRSVELDLGRGRLLEPALHWVLRRTWPVETAGMTRLIDKGDYGPKVEPNRSPHYDRVSVRIMETPGDYGFQIATARDGPRPPMVKLTTAKAGATFQIVGGRMVL